MKNGRQPFQSNKKYFLFYTFYKTNPAKGLKLLWRDLFMGKTENEICFKIGNGSGRKKTEDENAVIFERRYRLFALRKFFMKARMKKYICLL